MEFYRLINWLINCVVDFLIRLFGTSSNGHHGCYSVVAPAYQLPSREMDEEAKQSLKEYLQENEECEKELRRKYNIYAVVAKNKRTEYVKIKQRKGHNEERLHLNVRMDVLPRVPPSSYDSKHDKKASTPMCAANQRLRVLHCCHEESALDCWMRTCGLAY